MTNTADDSSGKVIEEDSKTEKLAIDEKYDTNWCDMPPEIKLKCIGKMDFAMRYRLGQTARAENKLVDSLRYKFDALRVFKEVSCCSLNHFEGEPIDYVVVDLYSKSYDIAGDIKFQFPFVLKHHDFEEIVIHDQSPLHQVDFVNLNTVLEPRFISWSYEFVERTPIDYIKSLQFFECCWDQVEKIEVCSAFGDFPLEKFLAIPSVFNAKALGIQFWNFQSTQSIPLIEKWIENDAPVGTKLAISYGEQQDFAPLFDHFQSRVIYREESKMRIKTDDPEKHILMHYSGGDYPYFCVTVVSSDSE